MEHDKSTALVREFAPGSCSEVAETLGAWARLSPRGLSRVECNSEYARLSAVQQLKEYLATDGIPFHEISLPRDCSAIDAIRHMLSQLRTLEPGVVSISGFPSAFPHDDDLYPLNANRENFAETPHRQIWWMPHSFTDRFIRFAPDLNSWFMIRPVLTETPYKRESPLILDKLDHSRNIHIDDARRYSASLYKRFKKATEASARWEDRVGLAIDAVQSLIDAGARQEALELFEKVIDRVKPTDEALATQSVNMADRFAKLATIYKEFGRSAEAEPLAKRALEIDERVRGHDHPSTARSLNNLASLYGNLGLYDQAEPLHKRALDIHERVLGHDHPSTALSLNNLANLYINLGLLDQAEPLLKRALDISERVLGLDHPDTASTLNNLASLYSRLGHHDQAEALFKNALEIREQVLGPDHPSTATSLNNLACLYHELGQYDRAEPLLKHALEIRERVLGPDHPATASSLNNLACLYQESGQNDQSEALFQHALKIRESTVGPNHPHVATVLENLANLLTQQGRSDEASPLEERASSIRKATAPSPTLAERL